MTVKYFSNLLMVAMLCFSPHVHSSSNLEKIKKTETDSRDGESRIASRFLKFASAVTLAFTAGLAAYRLKQSEEADFGKEDETSAQDEALKDPKIEDDQAEEEKPGAFFSGDEGTFFERPTINLLFDITEGVDLSQFEKIKVKVKNKKTKTKSGNQKSAFKDREVRTTDTSTTCTFTAKAKNAEKKAKPVKEQDARSTKERVKRCIISKSARNGASHNAKQRIFSDLKNVHVDNNDILDEIVKLADQNNMIVPLQGQTQLIVALGERYEIEVLSQNGCVSELKQYFLHHDGTYFIRSTVRRVVIYWK